MPYICDNCEYIFRMPMSACPFCGTALHNDLRIERQLIGLGYTLAPLPDNNLPAEQHHQSETNPQAAHYQSLQKEFQAQLNSTQNTQRTPQQTSQQTSFQRPPESGGRPIQSGQANQELPRVTPAEPLQFPTDNTQLGNSGGYFSQFQSTSQQVSIPEDEGSETNNTYYTVHQTPHQPVAPTNIPVRQPRAPRNVVTHDWRRILRITAIIIAAILVIIVIFNFNAIIGWLWQIILASLPILIVIGVIIYLIRRFLR